MTRLAGQETRSVPTEEPSPPVVGDELTERLTKVAYATEFLDVREDILALIERDRRRGSPDRPRR